MQYPWVARRVLRFGLPLCSLFLLQTAQAAVSFTISPNLVGNNYVGPVTFTVTGLTNTEKVVVQDFADLNGNGGIDGGDVLVQQFQLADGQATVFSGQTNINVPGDMNPAAGAITAQFSFQSDQAGPAFVGSYAFRLSSPSGRFTPITNSFTVTNKVLGQSFTGNVRNNGSNVPNAFVVLLTSNPSGDYNLTGGTVANGSGAYSLQAAAGIYSLAAFKSNYVAAYRTLPVVLPNGATFNLDLSLTNATRVISGRIVDSATTSLGLGGVFVTADGTNGQVAIAFTDTNGNFTLPATAQPWKVRPEDQSLANLGYLSLQDGLNVDASTGSVSGLTIAVTKATAMFYGSVMDDLGHPLPGVHLLANGDQFGLEGTGESDANGNYSVGVTDGFWSVNVDFGATASNYVFAQTFNHSYVNPGDAILQNFIGKVATNRITGTVKDNLNNPLPNIQVGAVGRISSTTYTAPTAMTEADGSFAFNLANGTWFITPQCGDPSGLNQFQYECPSPKSVVLTSSPGIANFIVTNLHPLLSAPRELAGNQFQFFVSGFSGRNYSVIYSTNLTNWTPLYTTTAPSNSFMVQDPSASGSRRFYRAQLVAGPFTLSFSEYAYPGNFGGNLTPTVAYPVSLNSYRTMLTVGYDIGYNFPNPSSVLFTGPVGSGLSASPADDSLSFTLPPGGYASLPVSSPVAAPGGNWAINYAGSVQSLSVPDPQAASRLAIPVPTLILNGSLIQSVSWSYKNATNGATLSGPPAYINSIQVQIEDSFGGLYNSPALPPATTSYTLSLAPDVNDLAILSIVYSDSLGNSYVMAFHE